MRTSTGRRTDGTRRTMNVDDDVDVSCKNAEALDVVAVTRGEDTRVSFVFDMTGELGYRTGTLEKLCARGWRTVVGEGTQREWEWKICIGDVDRTS